MNSKTFSLIGLGILALVLTLGLASAAVVLNPTGLPLSAPQGGSDSFTYTVFADYPASESALTNLQGVASNLVSGSNTIASSNIVVGTTSPSPLPAGQTSSAVQVTVNVPSNQAAGTYTGTITVDAARVNAGDQNPVAQTIAVQLVVTQGMSEASICAFTGGASVASQAEMVVDIKDITVAGFGEDEEWLLFDEVEVELKVENNGDFDLDDITVEWAIANDDLTDFAIDFDEVDEVSIKDGDEETLTVSFVVDDDDLDMDLEELSGLDYNLVFRAVGTIDDPDNGALDGDLTCAADFRAISIQDESDFVILTDLNVPETVMCGQNVQIRGNVLNIGDSQQDEVKVEVFDRNKVMIDELFQVGDLDEFDNTELSFTLNVPKSAETGTHTLVFRVLDEDSDVYENDFDEDPSEVFVPLTISGGCVPEVTITASTVSGSQEGKRLVVKATITNSGDKQSVYALSLSGANAWASSASLDQSSIVLAAGESKDVLASFDVNDDAEGSQTFNLDLVSEGQVTSQPVTVSIAPSSGLFGMTGNSVLGGPAVVGLGILVLILVIAIIVVAVRRK